jgi:hypothetical protein
MHLVSNSKSYKSASSVVIQILGRINEFLAGSMNCLCELDISMPNELHGGGY